MAERSTPGDTPLRVVGDFELMVDAVTEQICKLHDAALRLLNGVSPFHGALECEIDADGVELYGDLAEALGLPRDYGSDHQ